MNAGDTLAAYEDGLITQLEALEQTSTESLDDLHYKATKETRSGRRITNSAHAGHRLNH